MPPGQPSEINVEIIGLWSYGITDGVNRIIVTTSSYWKAKRVRYQV